MWAALSPLKPWPRPPNSTTKQLPRRHSMVILHNRRQGREEEEDDDEARVTAKDKFKFTASKEQQLSGADVLIALEKATTAKKARARDRDRDNSKKLKMEASRVSTHNLRPLCIKPEWASQLDDLEIRLQQLTHT